MTFLSIGLSTLFLIWILCYFVHLDLVADTWWGLRALQVSIVMVNDLLLGVLLMNIVFWSSRSGRARIWINTSNTIVVIWRTKCCILINIFLLQVNGAASMWTGADSASFVALIIGLERALGVHGSQEWVVSWTRACRASWLISGTTSIFFNIDVIIIILVSSLCFTLTFWVFTHLVIWLIIIITHGTWKVLNVHLAHILPFLGLMKWITAWAQIHEITSAIIRFEHNHILLTRIILILTSSVGLAALRQILVFVILIWCLGILFAHIVIIVTSASSFDITSVAIWILVSKIEVITSILTLPFGIYTSSISLIKKFGWEYSVVSTEELPGRFLAIYRTVNTWFFSRVIIFWILCSKFVKVIMFNCLSGSYSLIGIHIKHFLH